MVINMRLPKKLLALLVAAMCAVLAAGGCNPQKTPDYGINPVALSVNGVDITLFDFDRFYTTNEKYYYLTHGAVDAQEYFETVLDEVVRYGVALLKEEQTAAYSVEIWKRFRKWGGIPTGITQNVKDLLSSREVENIFASVGTSCE